MERKFIDFQEKIQSGSQTWTDLVCYTLADGNK